MAYQQHLEDLKSSTMCYSLKINRDSKGVAFFPCEDCKTLRGNGYEYPENREGENRNDDVWCFKKCEYSINVKLFDDEQRKIYIEKRPKEKMKKDYLEHPENEEFYKSIPDISEKILVEIIVK